MTVQSVVKDPEKLTMTVTAEFAAPVNRVWQVWADPRQLERWWGPPTYPATFEEHDLSADGRATYYMTGPEGDRHRGWWKVISVEEPHRLEIVDGFAQESGEPNDDLPVVSMSVNLEEITSDHTRMTVDTKFPSIEAMEKLVQMGIEEGLQAALGQIDDILLVAQKN